MKRILFVVAVFAFGLSAASPALAQEPMTCADMAPTIESLRMCVEQAIDMGDITDPTVASGLLDKLDAAQAALDRGGTGAAIQILESFINLVEAQSGKSIEANHASHMIMHANLVIDALGA